MAKYICDECHGDNMCESIDTGTVHPDRCPYGCSEFKWRKVEDEEPERPVKMHGDGWGYSFDWSDDVASCTVSYNCPGCKEKDEARRINSREHAAEFTRLHTAISDSAREIKEKDKEIAEKNRQISVLERELVKHIGDIGKVQNEADLLADIRDHLMAEKDAEIQNLKEQIRVQEHNHESAMRGSAQILAKRHEEIEWFKKRNALLEEDQVCKTEMVECWQSKVERQAKEIENLKKESEFRKKVIAIKDQTIAAEREKNAGGIDRDIALLEQMADAIDHISDELDKWEPAK